MLAHITGLPHHGNELQIINLAIITLPLWAAWLVAAIRKWRN